jgi:hypothetical protein
VYVHIWVIWRVAAKDLHCSTSPFSRTHYVHRWHHSHSYCYTWSYRPSIVCTWRFTCPLLRSSSQTVCVSFLTAHSSYGCPAERSAINTQWSPHKNRSPHQLKASQPAWKQLQHLCDYEIAGVTCFCSNTNSHCRRGNDFTKRTAGAKHSFYIFKASPSSTRIYKPPLQMASHHPKPYPQQRHHHHHHHHLISFNSR